MNKGKWIIGDVHGCYDTLMQLISKLPEDAELIFVGDLIDRGPNSRKVIDFIRNSNHVSVMGNHEEMMVNDIESLIEDGTPLWLGGWSGNGGDVTLSEYKDINDKVDNAALQEDYEWVLNLPVVHIESQIKDELGRQLVVTHSAIGDNIDSYMRASDLVSEGVNENVSEHEMIDLEHSVSNIEMITLWERRVPKKTQDKYFNIFGHTPIDNFAFKGGIGGEDKVNGCLTGDNIVIDKEKGYANIDSGCVYIKKRYGKYRGTMTAIHFPSLEVIQQDNIDYD